MNIRNKTIIWNRNKEEMYLYINVNTFSSPIRRIPRLQYFFIIEL